MSLAHRIIPVILTRGRTLVKGERFDSWRSVGVTAQAVRIHQARGVDELVLLDIGATPEGRGPDLDLVRELSEVCYMPLAVGGGVRTVDDVWALLRAGADKVVIGTACNTGLLVDASQRFGRQALVAAIDVRGRDVITACGTKPLIPFQGAKAPRVDAVYWADVVEHEGAGEILLTSIDREGTMAGYDLELIQAVATQACIPIIANGGCSGPSDMVQAHQRGASACAAGALFQFTDTTPRDCAEYMKANGIEVRI